MSKQSKHVPMARVYSLLKAANPGKRVGEETAQQANSASAKAFDGTIAAAHKANTAQEFTTAATAAAGSCGAITEATVSYPGDGTVRIHIEWENCPGQTTIYAGFDL
jgi:hypothetical protein